MARGRENKEKIRKSKRKTKKEHGSYYRDEVKVQFDPVLGTIKRTSIITRVTMFILVKAHEKTLSWKD